MIKKIGLLLILVSLSALTVVKAQDHDNTIDKVVWIVGDEAILKSDVEAYRIDMLANGQRLTGDPYCFIPEQIAWQKLFLDQAKIDSITVTNSDVARSMTMYENNLIKNLGSKEKVEEYFRAPMAELRDRWRDDLKNNYMIEQAQNNIVGKKIKLTPSEVRKYYTQLPLDSLPYIQTSVEVQIIEREPTVPLSEIDAVKNRLRQFSEDVQSGKSDFATLAIINSEDVASAMNGGELGFTTRAILDPNFANAAFSLNDSKKISNIVESEFGYHIIQMIERRGDRINVRHILLRPRIPEEEIKSATHQIDSLLLDIKAGKFTFEEATVLSTDKDTKANEGLMINSTDSPYNGTSRFRMEDLPPQISKVIVGMGVGDISEPFIMETKNGKKVVAAIKLKNRIEGHVANITDDYQALKDIVEAKKKEELIAKWVKNKVKTTYVYIDKDWQNCDFKFEGWIK